MGIMPMFDKGAILNPVAAFQKQLELAFVTLLKIHGRKSWLSMLRIATTTKTKRAI